MTTRTRTLAVLLGIALVLATLVMVTHRPERVEIRGSEVRVREKELPAPHLTGTTTAEERDPDAATPAERAAVRGLVVGPEGGPAAGALVALHQWVPRTNSHGRHGLVEFRVGTRLTGESGRFAFADLEPGAYWVIASSAPNLLSTSEEFELGDEDVEIVVPFRRAVAIRVEVVTETGEAVPRADVILRRSGTRLLRGVTGPDGVAVIEGADPGLEFRLEVTVPADRWAELFDRVEELWTPKDECLVLERALCVTGRVVDEDGLPLPNASVAYQPAPGGDEWNGVHTEDGGTFRILRLRPGRIRLRAGPPGTRNSSVSPALTVEAGRGDVELVVRRGGARRIVITNWAVTFGSAADLGVLILTPAGRPREAREFEIRPDATVEASGLEEGVGHVLWCRSRLLADHYVHVTGVRASPEPLEVRLEEGGVVTGRVARPSSFSLLEVTLLGPGVERRGELDPVEGTFRIRGVPPGVWTVQASGWPPPASVHGRQRDVWRAEAQASVGDEVELTMERYEER